MTASESAAGQQPIPLFDGTSLRGWIRMDGKPVEEDGEVVEGTLHLTDRPGSGANLCSEQQYLDLELEFEWRIAPKGNNGLKYRVRKYRNQYLGCEYQILDDAAHKLSSRSMTGSLYELYKPSDAKQLRPVGKFNQSRIVVRGNHIEHWLNGARIVSADMGTSEWYQRVAESKFRDVEGDRDGHLDAGRLQELLSISNGFPPAVDQRAHYALFRKILYVPDLGFTALRIPYSFWLV